MNNSPSELVQMRGGVVYVNRSPVLRFASAAQAGVFLLRLGYRGKESGQTFTFWKPAPHVSAAAA